MENTYFTNGNELYFAKVREDAIIPTKDVANAGYDIYACFDEDFMVIQPHCTALVPTGIACAMADDYYLQLEERGSTGSKGIKRSAGVVDSNYRGVIFAAITNVTEGNLVISKLDREELASHALYREEYEMNENTIVYPYSKAICQGIVHVVPKMDPREISFEALKQIPSDRGDGALGSTGK